MVKTERCGACPPVPAGRLSGVPQPLTKRVLVLLLGLTVGLLPSWPVNADLAKVAAAAPTYVVRKGDTLYAIARRHGLSIALLKSFNGLRSDRLKPGQRLTLGQNPTAARLPETPQPPRLQTVVESYLATPYRFGGSSRDGIDCSAFVQQVLRDLDIPLPRSAREQYWYGQEVDRALLQSGDLVFFRTYADFPSHVGIYLGDGKMVHASARSHRVVVSDIDQPYYRKRYLGAKRFAGIAPAQFDLPALNVETEAAPDDDTAAAGGQSPSVAPAPAAGVGG